MTHVPCYRKEISSLYVLKAFCAFGVVLLHTQFFAREYFIPICRLAVPLFFMISGYFMVSDTGEVSVTHLWKTIQKIFRINLITTTIYLLFFTSVCLLQYTVTGDTNFRDLFYPENFWRKFLLANPYVRVLWYLVAYMEALLVIIFSVRFKFYAYLQKYFPLFFVLGLLIGVYNFWSSVETIYHRNFIMTAIPFIMLGAWIKQHLQESLVIWGRSLSVLLGACLIFAYIEYFILKLYDIENRGDYSLTTIFLSFFLFLFLVRSSDFGKNTVFVSIGKYLSLSIYLYHVLVYEIIHLIMFKLCYSYYEYYSNFGFLIVLFFTIILSAFIYNFKKKNKSFSFKHLFYCLKNSR